MLYLNKHVFSCFAQRRLYLLDTKKDKYHVLEPEEVVRLAGHMVGIDICDSNENKIAGPPRGLIQALFHENLVTENAANGKPVSLKSDPIYATIEINLEGELDQRINLRHLYVVLWAFLIAVCRKHIFPFYQCVRLLERRKSSGNSMAASNEVLELTKAFHALRPFIPVPRNCLLDSLALLEFLYRNRVTADIVFAIDPEPFLAHCWVEWHGHYLNDHPTGTMTMTPILHI